MPEPFKNVYNLDFFEIFTNNLKKLKSDFNKQAFLKTIFDDKWENRELKQRMRHISVTLNSFLSKNYQEAINLLVKVIKMQQSTDKSMVLKYMFIPDYIEIFGINEFQTSVEAIEEVTQYSSCEFAVRPFIVKYGKKMMEQMEKWTKHKHPAVRRLASEGCRPRLPWAMSLPEFKKSPTPILPILENLKNDESLFVRKSVANNLNDISKDNPELVIKLLKKWKGKSFKTDWILKHGCRTLLKNGNTEVLEIFGFGNTENLLVNNFEISTPIIAIGDYLEFSFDLKNISDSNLKVRLEYCIYYQKANGNLNPKIYKISEKKYLANSETKIKRRQSFKIISTRKFHTGAHQLSIKINGKESEKSDFELINR